MTGQVVQRKLQLIKEPSSSEVSHVVWIEFPIIGFYQESCLTNEFGKLRPRKCDYKFCAFCEKLPEPKPIVMKGFCDSVTEEEYIFDREYYPDGIKNGRINFR